MSLRLFQRLFNVMPWPNAEYIVDYKGEKFWLYWHGNTEEITKLRARYRSYPAGMVTLVQEDDLHLTIADISIAEKYRNRGVGKGLLKQVIQWAEKNHFKQIWGFIKAHDGSTSEYLQEWYKRQGFEVYEAKPGAYQILMKLNNKGDQ